MYRYETHLHTYPVSACGQAGVEESIAFYKELGYDGVFVTNHFLDGNINIDPSLPYAERIHFYFSDYEQAVQIGQKLGIRVFCGVELSESGTDFLIYGLDKAWFLTHPEIMTMSKKEELRLMMACGALVIHAHPYREAHYIDHIRLYPREVHAVEVINANRTDEENEMAKKYAEHYGLPAFAGSDNHFGRKARALAGMESREPIRDVQDFITKVKNRDMRPFFCRCNLD